MSTGPTSSFGVPRLDRRAGRRRGISYRSSVLRLTVGAGLVAALALSALGCADGGGGDGGTDGVGGEGGSPSVSEQEVLESCLDFADRLCGAMRSCCLEAVGAHDAEECKSAFERNVCRPGAGAVHGGFATFHPEAAAPCLKAYEDAFTQCRADWQSVVELRRRLWSECRIIVGNALPGRSCTTEVTCNRGEGPTRAICSGGTCREITILEEGDECPFPAGDVSICDVGLYCTAPGLDTMGVCASATPEGGGCTEAETPNACGLGSYCDASSECQPATNFGGGSCSQHAECVSFNCDKVRAECSESALVTLEGCTGQMAP